MPDWQEILDRDGPSVWATAYRLLGNRADADECFQEALLAALEVSRREEVQHWRALLQRLATARAVDRLRQRRRRRITERLTDWASLRDPAPLPAQEAEDAELSARLRTAFAQIPAKQAQVFCLHELGDWSYQEIAQQLTISTDSVGVLLHRARRRLRQLLDSYPEVPRTSGRRPAVGPVPPSLRKEPP
jgi:RNA polymerase sigma-70 factor (ECF subfamily)